MRYLKNLYIESNRHDINYKISVISIFVAFLSLIVSFIMGYISNMEISNTFKCIIFILSFVFAGITTYTTIKGILSDK